MIQTILRSRTSWRHPLLGAACLTLLAGLFPAGAEAQSSGRSRDGRASITRSGDARVSGDRTTVRRGNSAHRSRGHRGHRGRHGHRGYRGRSHSIGLHLGYGYFGYPYYYGYPYYRGYYPHHYGPYRYGYPYEYRARRSYAALGAFDLDVKPKKTEVYLNGRLIGTAGKFDGYPGYLWLPKGEHQLVFYRPGFQTEERLVEALPDVLIDLEIDMQPGEATPVEEVAIEPEQTAGVERRAYRGPRGDRPDRPAPRTEAEGSSDSRAHGETGETDILDVRGEPGRVVLRVAPGDASVYLDGRFLGTADELERLHAGLLVDGGDHLLEVVRPGFRSESIEFTLEAGEEEIVAVDLTES